MGEHDLPSLSDWVGKKLVEHPQNAEDHLMFLRVERLLNRSRAVLDGEPFALRDLRDEMTRISPSPPADQGSML
jgi:hypothetical protein